MKQNFSYKKLKCLYKGYSGKVYLVEYQSENEAPNSKQAPLVLKRYYRKPNDPGDVTSLNEFKILSGLDHPNIVALRSSFTEKFEYKKYLCLTFDFMAPLSDMLVHLKQSRLFIFQQIVDGLTYLHKLGILHRDIKPSNIFGTLEGKIKIGDFGISSKLHPTMTPQVCTKNYRPPELFFGQHRYDESVDLWALGCTLAEIFLGKVLFDGHTEIEIMSKITEQLGSMNETSWPGVSSLPTYLEFANDAEPKLQQTIQDLPETARKIVTGLLKINPSQRMPLPEVLSILGESGDHAAEVAAVSCKVIGQQLKPKA